MSWMETLGKAVVEGIGEGLNRAKENSTKRIKFEIYRLEKRLINNILFVGFMLISCLLISLGLVLLLDQYLGIGLGLSFLVIGIIVLLIGIIFKTI